MINNVFVLRNDLERFFGNFRRFLQFFYDFCPFLTFSDALVCFLGFGSFLAVFEPCQTSGNDNFCFSSLSTLGSCFITQKLTPF